MNDMERYKMKKQNQRTSELAASMKRGGIIIAEAIYALPYKAKEIDSQMKANKRIIDKLNTQKEDQI